MTDFQLNSALEESVSFKARSRIFNLSNGASIRVKGVNALTARDVSKRFRAPKIPVIHDPDRGIDIPNPNDPNYLQAMDDYAAAVNEASENVMLVQGIEVINLPESVWHWTDDEWVEEVEFLLGVTIPTRGAQRKVFWMRHVLFTSTVEISAVLEEILSLSGTREVVVEDAMDNFSGDAQRQADTGSGATAQDTDGD